MPKSPTMQRLQLDGPMLSRDPHPPAACSRAARSRRRHRRQQQASSARLDGGAAPQPPPHRLWRRPKISAAELEHFLEFNQSNLAADAPTEESRKVNWLHQFHDFQPTTVGRVYDSDLPVHYWFYVYTHSCELNLVLTPFQECGKIWPADKRLLCVMRRNGVNIILKDLELYKSLPRRLVVIKALDWPHILSTLADLEMTLPDMMRYASYPLLVDTDSCRYPSTSNAITAVFSRAGTLI